MEASQKNNAMLTPFNYGPRSITMLTPFNSMTVIGSVILEPRFACRPNVSPFGMTAFRRSS